MKILVLLMFFFSFKGVWATSWRIEVITFSPGSELYSTWGHTALRFQLPSGQQELFDYGTFQFSENFFTEFLLGTPKYWLSHSSWAIKERVSKHRRVGLWTHELILPENLIEATYNKLKIQSRTNDRFYDYDALTSNCTTIVRDLVDELTDGDFLRTLPQRESITFRTVHQESITGNSFFHFVILTVFNHRVEENIDSHEALYLPVTLFNALEEYAERNPDQITPAALIMEPAIPERKNFPWQYPVFMLLVIIMGFQYFSKGSQYVFVIFSCVRAILGVALALFFISNWSYFSMNPALLVYNPLPLLSTYKPWSQPLKRLQVYLAGILILISLGQVGWDRYLLYSWFLIFDLFTYAKASKNST